VTGPDALTINRWKRYSWPGNVRELRNTLERYAVHGKDPVSKSGGHLRTVPSLAAQAEDPAGKSGGIIPYRQAKARHVEAFERAYVEKLLQCYGHNLAQASRRSGMARSHLHRLVTKYGLRRGNVG